MKFGRPDAGDLLGALGRLSVRALLVGRWNPSLPIPPGPQSR
jgi:hypothetical protein